jgi:two-component system, LytTR family, response regulator
MNKKKIHCIIVDDEPVAREILEGHLKRIDQVHVVASCKNATEAFKAINIHHVDLDFLDIQMPGISGLSFARSVNRNLRIIFTTAYREYAVEGFDLRAVDYLLKPISFERLLQGIQKYLEENDPAVSTPVREAEESHEDFIFVRSERKMIRVDFPDIHFMESLGDYIKIHLRDGKSLVTRESISNLESSLPGEEFIRVHRSYIVALHQIDSYTSDTIGIVKHEIPISRSYREEVRKKLGDGDYSQARDP